MNEWRKLSLQLNDFLNSIRIWDDGTILFTRHYVPNADCLPIHIMANEHAPPHFHVKSSDGEACYKIEREGPLTKISGEIEKSLERKIKYLYEGFIFRDKLIEIWNSTRPDGCPVGKID